MDEDEAVEIELSIVRKIPDDLRGSRFSDDFVIQHRRNSFTMSFFEIVLPIVVESSRDETIEQYKKLEHIEALCVGRITVTPFQLKRIAEAIISNIDSYERKFGLIEDDRRIEDEQED